MKRITTLAVAAILIVSGESLAASKPSGNFHSSKPVFVSPSHNVPYQPSYKPPVTTFKQITPNYQAKFLSYNTPKSFFPKYPSIYHSNWYFPSWGFGWNWYTPWYPVSYPYLPFCW